MLLKVGRHLRPKPHFKVIIAREEGEGNFLLGYRKQYISIISLSHSGPEAKDFRCTEGPLSVGLSLFDIGWSLLAYGLNLRC